MLRRSRVVVWTSCYWVEAVVPKSSAGSSVLAFPTSSQQQHDSPRNDSFHPVTRCPHHHSRPPQHQANPPTIENPPTANATHPTAIPPTAIPPTITATDTDPPLATATPNASTAAAQPQAPAHTPPSAPTAAAIPANANTHRNTAPATAMEKSVGTAMIRIPTAITNHARNRLLLPPPNHRSPRLLLKKL